MKARSIRAGSNPAGSRGASDDMIQITILIVITDTETSALTNGSRRSAVCWLGVLDPSNCVLSQMTNKLSVD